MSNPATKHEALFNYEQMGFDRTLVLQAWNECKGDESRMLEILLSLNEKNQKMIEESTAYKPPPQQMGSISNEDVEINKAIELSLKEQKNMPSVYEPLNPEQRLRKSGMPIGLKNIGNTCYANPLLQAYFQSPKFVSAILNYNPEIKVEESKQAAGANKEEKDVTKLRTEAAIKQLKSLRKLFGMMIKSHKKYVDPTDVLHSVVDDFGQRIPVGDQQDATEYHTNFLSRLEEAFAYQERFNRAKNEQRDPDSIHVEEAQNVVDVPLASGHFQSSGLNEDNSLVLQHFFGRMKQFRHFAKQGEPVTDETDVVFGPLIVDVANKDLENSLEKYCNFTIDDYKLPTGEMTKVEGNSWIVRPPEFLFIQLNRVSFDKESGLPLKINDRFTFEKELYFDRFMLEYRNEAFEINRTISKLRHELEDKENSLQKIVDYLKTGLDIIKVLGITGDFLKQQIGGLPQMQTEGLDPTSVKKLVPEPEINAALRTIQSYKDYLESQRDILKNDIVKAKEEIKKLCRKLHKHKYQLVSVVIHDGVAGSGHYYSFNRNVEKDTWKRFNDIQVADENEETVMKEAIGGYSNISAYCLIYVADHTLTEEAAKPEVMEIQDSKIIEIEKQSYYNQLPADLSSEVEADNVVFHEEIEEYRFNSYLKGITDTYKARIDAVTKGVDVKDPKAIPTHLNSFGCYLKSQKTVDDIFKWYILDTTLRSSEKKINLNDLIKNSPRLIKILEDRVSSLPTAYSLKHVTLSSAQEEKLHTNFQNYQHDCLVFFYSRFFITAMMEEKIKDACDASRRALETEKDPKNFYIKLITNVARINCLRMALEIEKAVRLNEIDRALAIFSFLTPIAKGLLRQDDVQMLQIKAILVDIVSQAQGKLAESDYNRLKQEQYKLSTGIHRPIELDKLLVDFNSQLLQEELNVFNSMDFYEWREIDENSLSNQTEKLMEDIKRNYKMIVELQNQVFTRKTALKLEEREKSGFIIE